MYNFHPGSHTGLGVENGIELISCQLNRILTKGQTTTVLLETMDRKGHRGRQNALDELREILDRIELSEKVRRVP